MNSEWRVAVVWWIPHGGRKFLNFAHLSAGYVLPIITGKDTQVLHISDIEGSMAAISDENLELVLVMDTLFPLGYVYSQGGDMHWLSPVSKVLTLTYNDHVGQRVHLAAFWGRTRESCNRRLETYLLNQCPRMGLVVPSIPNLLIPQ